MDISVIYILLVVFGLLIGMFTAFLFGKFPESWLQDYDYDPKAPDFRLSKRMKYFPHGLIAGVCCSVTYFISVSKINGFNSVADIKWIHLSIIILVVPVFVLTMFADKLNRIIPDQFSIYTAIVGLLSIAADLIEGSYWISPNAPWYVFVLNHVIGAVIGGGVLLLINFICETFMGTVGMGMGDVKLLGATGFLVGGYGLYFTFLIAIFVGAIYSIPLIVRKYVRIAKENKEIKNSKNPSKTRREIQMRKNSVHYADDPDYLAFGPFIALGGAAFLALEPLLLIRFIGVFESFNLLF